MEDEEEEGGGGDGAQRVPAEETRRSDVPTGEVVGVKSREDLRALTEEGGTMVFVSSRSCRACKYLVP